VPATPAIAARTSGDAAACTAHAMSAHAKNTVKKALFVRGAHAPRRRAYKRRRRDRGSGRVKKNGGATWFGCAASVPARITGKVLRKQSAPAGAIAGARADHDGRHRLSLRRAPGHRASTRAGDNRTSPNQAMDAAVAAPTVRVHRRHAGQRHAASDAGR